MILLCYLGEVLKLGPILAHVLQPSVGEHDWRERPLHLAIQFLCLLEEVRQRRSPVAEETLQRASEHLFKAKGKDTLGLASSDRLMG